MSKENKQKVNKKEVRNIAVAGVTGGVAGAANSAGSVAFNNYKDYSRIKNAYLDKYIEKYIKEGFNKKDAYKKALRDISKAKIPLNKIIKEYSGTAKHNIGNAYKIKAMSEMPYKTIGGALAGVPIGMLAYGQISNAIDNMTKKNASCNMVYFEKISSEINRRETNEY